MTIYPRIDENNTHVHDLTSVLKMLVAQQIIKLKPITDDSSLEEEVKKEEKTKKISVKSLSFLLQDNLGDDF